MKGKHMETALWFVVGTVSYLALAWLFLRWLARTDADARGTCYVQPDDDGIVERHMYV